MTLCLFGGAFNPPHRTHERVARAALARLPIDLLVILPTGHHPLKPERELAPAAARVELCRLAFGGIPRVRVDDWETRQPGPSYSVDTLRHYREYSAPGSRPYWIVGSDNLALLPQWHRYHEFLAMAVLVTVPRLGHPVSEHALAQLDLTRAEREEILAHVLAVEPDDVSASAIRARLRDGDPTDAWLDPAVARRIRELGLYGTTGPPPPS